MIIRELGMTVFGLLCGSILFGRALPKWIKGIDVTEVSNDHNPGTANSALLIRPHTKRTRITYIFFAVGAAALLMIQRIPRQVFWGALLISAIVIHKNSIRQEFLEEATESLESL